MKRSPVIPISILAVVIVVLLVAFHDSGQLQSTVMAEDAQRGDPILLQTTGYVTMLRAHDLGTGYGAGMNFLDVEVVIRLDSQPNNAFGFQLRNDDLRPAREGMLNLLRDAFNYNSIVTIDYWIEPGANNGQLIRVWLSKP